MRIIDRVLVEREIDALMAACPELAEDESLRHDMLQAETSAFELLDVLVKRAGECEAQRGGLKSYMEELSARDSRLERRCHGLRSLMHRIMECANLTKAQLASATLSIMAGRRKVIITDDTLISDFYSRLKREPDKTKIKAALEAGEYVPGAVLSNYEPTLAIRTR